MGWCILELSNSERKFKNSKNFPKPGSSKTSHFPEVGSF
jgi:hypothetical protein